MEEFSRESFTTIDRKEKPLRFQISLQDPFLENESRWNFGILKVPSQRIQFVWLSDLKQNQPSW